MASKRLRSLINGHWLYSELAKHQTAFGKAVLLNVLINLFQIVTSLFVMVVYNKVLPNNAVSSLYTLVIGISIVVVFDTIFKLIKSRIISMATDNVEEKLHTNYFKKFCLGICNQSPNYQVLHQHLSEILRLYQSFLQLAP